MQARNAERERIARELHDTLLQGTQALLMRIQNWETDPAIPEGHRREVAAVVNQARSMVIEGRDLILGLRGSDSQPADLVAAIAELERNEWAIEPPKFAITVIGRPKPVPMAALQQMLGIAREAIRNAHRHANANQLSAVLEFRAGAMRMSFSDDGVGIEPSAIEGRRHPNHFGLVGMRERAEQLGATLVVGRNGAKGTRVTLSMPLDTDT
jgi:signal transduction histidine kinase